MLIKKRSLPTTALGFFLEDWRWILQWSGFLLLIALAWSLVEFLDSELTTVFGAALLLGTNLFACLALLPPLVLFVWTGRAVVRTASSLVSGVVTLLVFVIYVALLLAAHHQRVDSTPFLWSAEAGVTTGAMAFAGAVALVVASSILVSFRFVTDARSLGAGLGRLALVFFAVVAWFGLDASRLSIGAQSNRSSEPPRLRIVLLLKNFDLSAAHLFFAEHVDETWRAHVADFRPVVMPSLDDLGQKATLLTGHMPFRHGMRGEADAQDSWVQLEPEWRGLLNNHVFGARLHVTNFANPDATSLFFGLNPPAALGLVTQQQRTAAIPAVGGMRCSAPDLLDHSHLRAQRVHNRVGPFVSQQWLQFFWPNTTCLLRGASLEEIVQREFVSELRPALIGPLGEGQAGVLSLWSFDVGALEDLSQEAGTPEHSVLAEPRERGRRLVRLVNMMRQNAQSLRDGLMPEIVVVGLARDPSSDTWSLGSYVFLSPSPRPDATWPLANENQPISLSDVRERLGFTENTKGSQVERAFYHERLLGAPRASLRRAMAMQREASCLFWDSGAEQKQEPMGDVAPTDPQTSDSASITLSGPQPKRLTGRLDAVAAPLDWLLTQRTELLPSGRTDRVTCERAIRMALQRSLDQDVHLLEPFQLREQAEEQSDHAVRQRGGL